MLSIWIFTALTVGGEPGPLDVDRATCEPTCEAPCDYASPRALIPPVSVPASQLKIIEAFASAKSGQKPEARMSTGPVEIVIPKIPPVPEDVYKQFATSPTQRLGVKKTEARPTTITSDLAPHDLFPREKPELPSARQLFEEAKQTSGYDEPYFPSAEDLFTQYEPDPNVESGREAIRHGGIDANTVITPEGSYTPRREGQTVLFPDSFFERAYDRFQYYKTKYHFPVSFAAWHWQHQNNDGPLQSGYGIPGIRGTYWWSVYFDPQIDLNHDVIQKAGAHLEYRLREQDQFRSFYNEKSYTWELYGWIETPYGRVKAGQLWKRFGLDWDGVFFGNVPYFDGFKLDPDIGFSWENNWKLHDNLNVATFVQFFIHEDGINGTIEGSDPESLVGSNERNTFVARVAPTWTLAEEETLTLGASALVGEIDNNQIQVGVPSQVLAAWALDATYACKRVRVFGEVLQSYGVLNPVRYTSGGPSNNLVNILTGIHYLYGPVTFRFNYSAGFDANPAGWQQFWLPGVTVALTKNIDFYAEWVRWDIFGNPSGSGPNGHVEFEDGYSFVINWRY